jgi:uncharacterized membrane protein YbhN (UPF0104 family)
MNDKLDPARGCVNACLISLVMWIIMGLVIWVVIYA